LYLWIMIEAMRKVLTAIKRVVAWMGKQLSFPSFDGSNNHLNHQH
jgi:hypothetical protein